MVTFKADSLNHIKNRNDKADYNTADICLEVSIYRLPPCLNMESPLFLNVEIFTLNNWTVTHQKNKR